MIEINLEDSFLRKRNLKNSNVLKGALLYTPVADIHDTTDISNADFNKGADVLYRHHQTINLILVP